MKKLLFAAAFLSTTFYCTAQKTKSHKSATVQKTQSTSGDMATMKTNKVYRAIETGDVSQLDDVFSDDCVNHGGGMNGEDIKGKDAVIADLKQFHNWFEGLKFEPIAQATSGDYHFSLVHMTGTVTNAASGMPVGTNFDNTAVDVVKIKNGKATDHWSYMSMKDMMEMMKNMGGGAMPQMQKPSGQ